MKLSLQATHQGTKALLQTSVGIFDVLIDKISDTSLKLLQDQLYHMLRTRLNLSKTDATYITSGLKPLHIADAFTTALLSGSIVLGGEFANANFLTEAANNRNHRRNRGGHGEHNSCRPAPILADRPVLVNLRRSGNCRFSWNPDLDKTRTRTVDDSYWFAKPATGLSAFGGAVIGFGAGPICATVGAVALGNVAKYLTSAEKEVVDVVVPGVHFERDGAERASARRDFIVRAG